MSVILMISTAILTSEFGTGEPSNSQANLPPPTACHAAQVVELSVSRADAADVIVQGPRGARNSNRVPVRLRQCLTAGERVRVTAPPPARIVIRLQGRTVALTAASGEFTIPGNQQPRFWENISSLIPAAIEAIFDTTPAEPIPVETYGQALRNLATAPHPLLPVTEQIIPADQQAITILWEGGDIAFVELRNEEDRISDSRLNPNGALATLDRQRVVGDARLLVGDTISYPLRIVEGAAPPEPAWQEGRPSLSEDERVARAVWLLAEGPVEWRLFGLNELRVLKESSFAAERIWEWVRQGRDAEGMPVR